MNYLFSHYGIPASYYCISIFDCLGDLGPTQDLGYQLKLTHHADHSMLVGTPNDRFHSLLILIMIDDLVYGNHDNPLFASPFKDALLNDTLITEITEDLLDQLPIQNSVKLTWRPNDKPRNYQITMVPVSEEQFFEEFEE